MRKKKEKELIGELAFGGRTTLKVATLVNQGQANGSKGRVDESEGDELSLLRISKVEIEEMRRRMRHIYRRKNTWKTKWCLRPEAEKTRTHHVSEALNEWQLEESSINDLPAPLNQKIVSQ